MPFRASMASSRLLHLVASPSPPAAAASASTFRRGIHVAAATSPESQHLRQFILEGIISVVGGEMVVADMRFTRDGFDYWRNAAIPSNSILKELALTWANVESLNSSSNIPFKFHADSTMGKKMEDFLQRMVVDVEQRITKKGFNSPEGRGLDVQLADKQELRAKEENPDFKQDLDRRLCAQSADEHENVATKQESNKSIDAQSADEQQILAKEGKSEAEKKLDRRLILHSFAEEKDSECEQLADEQDLMAKVEKYDTNLGRLEAQEIIGREERSEVMQEQSENEPDVICMQEQSLEAQKEEAKNRHATIKGIQSVSDGQNIKEREKLLEIRYGLKEKEGAEVQNVKASKQFKKREMEKEEGQLAADEQEAKEKPKRLVATHKIEEKQGEEREQNYGVVKDHYLEQTDNIVKMTRRMGRKIVHIYYDKSSGGRASL